MTLHRPKIMVAPNGARKTKKDHCEIPIRPDELAQTAKRCFELGATGIHLHVRDDNQQHSLDAGRYREAIAAVSQSAPDMAIQITTESAGIYDIHTQYQLIDTLRPKWISLAIREMHQDISIAKRIYDLANEANIQIQHILFSPECMAHMLAWIEQGIIKDPHPDVLFVLGRYTQNQQSEPTDILPFLQSIQNLDWTWTVCAFGRKEIPCLISALKQGGRARIGFENNLVTEDGTLLKDNADSVVRLTTAMKAEQL